MRRAVLAILLVGCGKETKAPQPQAQPQPQPQPQPEPEPQPQLQADAAPAMVVVPTEGKELQRWLAGGAYKAWKHESEKHVSEGPHGEEVITFVAPQLDASLAAGNPVHPKGAAAVKELYDEAGAHMGWAVSVKVADDSDAGKGWYWYEVFSTEATARPAYEGVGKKLCRECHADGGVDQVLITYPLQ